ncbi:AzlD domain-containing protein [Dactylosporangium sp. CA-139114]|uniref:AzlD domain-containing protein n=1 Tax=Dactylosporangium sp. CA-139114 TaxID=3239931 RepID=UPI003D9896EB
MNWIAIVVLAAGTYALRFAGPVLRDRITVSDELKRYLSLAAIALLAALIATAALVEGGKFVGIARPAGVLVGAVLAWRKAPFVVVVVAAALTAALLRVAGVE